MAEAQPADAPDRLTRARARWDSRPLHQYFDIRLDDVGDGYARFFMQANDHNRGGVHGATHGGVLAFLADVAALAAIGTITGPDDQASGTAELNISYLSPAVGSVITEATILRKGRTLVVADIDLKDESGKLLAKSRVSYALRARAGSHEAAGIPPE
ncbi:MAG TPA: PaaI family thioesterase [Dehalococcoidia bacterium]|nr:PaaI family thioesterase [Dehalococcoidia bacterium]